MDTAKISTQNVHIEQDRLVLAQWVSSEETHTHVTSSQFKNLS